MRVLILGASGNCGRWVTGLAGAEGHSVTAMVRPHAAWTTESSVTVRRGSSLNVDELREACVDQDVVISCIGPQRVNPWNPWSPIREPYGVAEQSARAIAQVGAGTSVKRFVCISAAGVGDSYKSTSFVMRWLIGHSSLGPMYADLNRMEDVLTASAIDWVAVRPVTLVHAPRTRHARELQYYSAYSFVGRADVAAWLLSEATAPNRPVNRTPLIGWW